MLTCEGVKQTGEMKMECQKDCTSMTKKHFRLQSLFFPFFFFLKDAIEGFFDKVANSTKKEQNGFPNEIRHRFPSRDPSKAGSLFLLFPLLLKQMHSEVLVKESPVAPTSSFCLWLGNNVRLQLP